MKRIFTIFLCLIMLISVSSCGKTYSNQINVGTASFIKTLDPQLAQSSCELMAVRNIFEGLFRFDKSGQLTLAAAESYSVDGNVLTLKIKKDLLWSNGEPLTAHDFVFGFKRAADPVTNAPNANMLCDILNAEDILNGNKGVNSLGVLAADDYTLKITLNKYSSDFLSLLTNAVFMPCNEKFFKECSGKYGRDIEDTISNGSYKISSWNTENFTVRLIRNKNYGGDFRAETTNVVLQYLPMTERAEKLKENGYDLIFQDSTFSLSDTDEVYNEVEFENTSWLLIFADRIPQNIRKAFIVTPDFEKIISESKELKFSNNIFPNCDYNVSYKIDGKIDAAKLFSDAVKESYTNKVPTYTIGYIDSTDTKSILSAIATSWQRELGAFINISARQSQTDLISASLLGEVDIMLMPIINSTEDYSTIPDKFSDFSSFAGIGTQDILNAKAKLSDVNESTLNSAQNCLLKNDTVLPLAFSSEKIVYSENLTVDNVKFGNGYIDFYSAVKIYK